MLTGQILKDRFHIYGELGQGSAATVYLARDAETGKVVVVKVVHSHLVDDEFTGRFEREIDLLGQLESPHIVRLLDWAVDEKHEASGQTLSYLVTDFVQGHSLSEIIETQGKLEEAAALAIARQLAETLSEIHAKGIIHRDVKSPNVMITPENNAMLIDFGIAKGPHHATLTSAEFFWGTLIYAPPEQMAEAREADHRADLYGLGVVLYEMLMGRLPVQEKEFWMVANRIMAGDLDPISGVSDPVAALVNEMMAQELEERIGSADEVIQRIDAILGSAVGPALPERPIAPDETVALRRLEESLAASAETLATATHPAVTPGYRLTTAEGHKIPLVGEETVIGRSGSADEVTSCVDLRALGVEQALTVSRQHCRLFNDAGELFVEDLASTNGTHLNGVPLEPEKTYRVVPGDVIHAGQVPLTLETADPETGRNLVARMLRAVSPERRN